MNINLKELLRFVRELKQKNIFYRMSSYREDAICIEVSVPGEHWEIDFLSDGSVDVEVFKSKRKIYGFDKIDQLIKENLD